MSTGTTTTVTAEEVVTSSTTNGIATIIINSPTVNTLSNSVREGLHQTLKHVIDAGARAIVIACAGRTFVAGAEISELGIDPEKYNVSGGSISIGHPYGMTGHAARRTFCMKANAAGQSMAS